MKIDLKTARKRLGEKIRYSGQLEITQDQLIDRKPLSPLTYEIACEYLDEKLFFYGHGDLKCECNCYRCGKVTEYNAHINFNDKIDLQEGEYNATNDKFSLDSFIIDKVILSQPSTVLCSKNCAGLCGTCGANLNLSKCDCYKEQEKDNPFYALKKRHE